MDLNIDEIVFEASTEPDDSNTCNLYVKAGELYCKNGDIEVQITNSGNLNTL
jgi:hypothetical protein